MFGSPSSLLVRHIWSCLEYFLEFISFLVCLFVCFFFRLEVVGFFLFCFFVNGSTLRCHRYLLL